MLTLHRFHSPSLLPPHFLFRTQSILHTNLPQTLSLFPIYKHTHTHLSAECTICRWHIYICIADDAVILYLFCEKAFGISELRALIALTFALSTTDPVCRAGCFHPSLPHPELCHCFPQNLTLCSSSACPLDSFSLCFSYPTLLPKTMVFQRDWSTLSLSMT